MWHHSAASRLLATGLLCVLCACEAPWNNPYRPSDAASGTFFSSFREQPKHFDPVLSYSEDEAEFIFQVYEPPVQYHFLKRPYELSSLTATEVPRARYFDSSGAELGPDAPGHEVALAVYTIRLRSGIRYQPHPAFATDDNGHYVYHELPREVIERANTLSDFPQTGTRELTAEDYVYQIKRLAHPRLHSPIYGLMREYIVGLDELAQRLATEQIGEDDFLDLRKHELEGVRALDRYTYEIRLQQKYPQFVYWLAMTFFAPIPWEADAFYSQPGMKEKNITLDWYPVGTGPFMVAENNPNRRIVLVRNPNFRGERYPTEGEAGDLEAGLLRDAGKLMPFIDAAYYTLEKEAIPEWNKFLQGYYDTAGIISDSFDQAISFTTDGEAQLTDEMRERGIGLLTAVTATTSYLGFNMFDDVVGGYGERARLLRRAVSIAVDYEELISIFANGRGVPAQGPLPPGIFGYREGREGINPYVYDWVDGRARRKSVVEARRLLARAGYPNGRDETTGEPLILYLDTMQVGPGSKSLLDWFRKQFQKIGVQLVVRATDYNRFRAKMDKGTAQIYTWGWNADYPDPENFMFLLYGPNAKAETQGENASNYKNPEFDSLFVTMKDMPNGPERSRIIDRMLEIARRDAPWLWGQHPKAFSLFHEWYGNAKPNLMARNSLKYKSIDPELRAGRQRQWNRPLVWPVVLVGVAVVLAVIPAFLTFRRRQRATAL
jgi:ABC-type transport system substrate-binding protein